MHEEVKGQLYGIFSLLPPLHRFQGWNLGLQFCVASTLDAELSDPIFNFDKEYALL